MILSIDIENFFHNRYKLGDNVVSWKKGGYGSVYLSKDKTFVIKKLLKYDKEDNRSYTGLEEAVCIVYVSYSTILEACLSKTLHYLPYYSKIFWIQTSARSLYICQKHHGIPLHRFIQTCSIEDIPLLMYKVIEAFCIMYVNGIQHTDIKPSNILVEKDKEKDTIDVCIIDYNCMSLQYVDMEGKLRWNNSIGTWQFVAPEILYDSIVHTNSCIWSIGLLITYIFQCFPLVHSIYDNVPQKNTITRDDWEAVIEEIVSMEGSNVGIFQKVYPNIPEKYLPFVKKMLVYSPEHRYCLHELVEDWKKEFGISYCLKQEDFTDFSIRVVPYQGTSKHTRRLLFTQFYEFCKKWNQLYKVFHIFHLFDSCYKLIHPTLEKGLLFGSWAICSLLRNEHLQEVDGLLEEIKDYYYIGSNAMTEMIWVIGDHLEWSIYVKPVDVWIVEEGYSLDREKLLEIFISQTEDYTMTDIFDRYVSC